MAKYLVRATFTSDGVKGLLKEGGSSRQATVKALAEGAGGSLEAFYFAFGDDVYAILELPDNASAAAASLAVNASGVVSSKVVVLLTPEEVDEATKMTVDYRAPGA